MTAEGRPTGAVLRHVSIPMPDGIGLSADIYLPPGAMLDDGGRRPVVFDYYPYRKDDWSAGRQRAHRYFAARGLLAARVDIRGTGSSGGTAPDEYALAEQQDALNVIEWFAAQPWSNGRVGMFGSSYGGFNSIQVAMLRPPALKAICPMYFTDNRYTDECHYRGGSLQMLYDLGSYGLSMVALNALPPSEAAVGDAWRRIWDEHLAAEPWLLRWLEHQTFDDYWRHGSLDQDYAAIECPTYLFGGWRDGYVSTNLRTFAALQCPKKLLVGPWTHTPPDAGVPGPQIDHLHEQARFFEHWLGGVDNGVMDEPPITIFVQRYDPPRGYREATSGFWRHESGWPLARSVDRRLYLTGDGLLTEPRPTMTSRVGYGYDPTVGTTFGMFAASSTPLIPSDQREEAGRSTCWTSRPLDDPLEILGRPVFEARVAVDAPVATIVVRLIDVAPDGPAAQVTKGQLNLTRRASLEHPEPLVPGEPVDVRIELDATSWEFEPAHRIELAITGSDYPYLWPSPYRYRGEIHVGAGTRSSLVLPTIGPRVPPLPEPDLRPPAPFEEAPSTVLEPASMRVTRDHATGEAVVRMGSEAITHLEGDRTVRTRRVSKTSVGPDHPAHASVRAESEIELRSQDRAVVSTAYAEMDSDAEAFQVSIRLVVSEDGERAHERDWRRSIPRRLL
jgi:putative CocE/NonD family hydrolase